MIYPSCSGSVAVFPKLSKVAMLAAAAGVCFGLSNAHAQTTRTWNNAFGGTAGTAGNWVPAGVPAAGDDLYFNIPFGYTVTFGAAVPETHWLVVMQGGLTFRFNAPHTNTYGLRVYGGSTATIDTGSFTGASILVPYTVGYPDPATAVISGSGTSVSLGTLPGFVDLPMDIADNGLLRIEAGADVVSTSCQIGRPSNLPGTFSRPSTLTVTGSGSTLDVTGGINSDITLGGVQETCTLNVLSGASVSCDGMSVSTRDQTTSNVNVNGASTLTVRAGIRIGALGAAATNTFTNLTIGSAGTMTVNGAIADNDGYNTTGTFNVNGVLEASGIRSNQSSLYVNDNGIARITSTAAGQTALRLDNIVVDASATGQLPTLVLNGSGFGALDVVCDNIRIGNTKAGKLDIRNGTYNFNSNNVTLGFSAGSTGDLLLRPDGQMRFNDGASLKIGNGGVGTATINGTVGNSLRGSVLVGTSGIGTMDVTGLLDVRELTIGAATAPATGAATFTGSLSAIMLGTVGAAYGSPLASLTLDSSSVLQVLNTNSGDTTAAVFDIGQSGQVFVNNSSLEANVGSTSLQTGILLKGKLQLNNGTVKGKVDMRANPHPDWPLLVGSGSVEGQVITIAQSVISASPNLSLDVGPLGNTSFAFVNKGRLIANNASTLTLRCDSATNDPGSTLEMTDASFRVLDDGNVATFINNGTIQGSGTFRPNLTNNGTVTPSTGPAIDGLTFTGNVTQAAPGVIQGSKIVFGPNSRFDGYGNILGKFTAEAGSIINVTGGNSIFGDNTVPDMSLAGTLRCNGNEVRLRCSNFVPVAGTGVINLGTGGTILTNFGLNLATGALLRGSGSITGRVNNTGVVSPDGTINVTGQFFSFFQGGVPGEIQIDVSGTGSSQHDLITSTGQMNVIGTLTVRFQNGYTPAVGDVIPILTSGTSRLGQFQTVNYVDSPAGVTWAVDYLPTSVQLRVVSVGLVCDSIDFNNDTSFFDPQDIEAFLGVYSEGPCIPSGGTCNDIDFNNDGGLFDPCDINSFLLMYSEGPCTNCGV